MNEQQIIAGCKNGDRKAQKVLYEKYSRMMYGICLRYTSDTASAQDLLQESFIKIFSNIHTFQEKGSFEGWMKRILINQALENIRKEKKIIHTSDDLQNYTETIDVDTEEQMYNISEVELRNMIQGLPKGYATVFNLYAIEDYSHREISEMLDITESTSRSQYVRARQMLQDKIKKHLKENS